MSLSRPLIEESDEDIDEDFDIDTNHETHDHQCDNNCGDECCVEKSPYSSSKSPPPDIFRNISWQITPTTRIFSFCISPKKVSFPSFLLTSYM